MRVKSTELLNRVTSVLLTLTLGVNVAAAQSGGAFDLSWSSIDGGGSASAGGMFALSGTIGQSDAGAMTGGTFSLAGGFWMGGDATTAVTDPDTNSGPGGGDQPDVFRVGRATPNPFSTHLTVSLELPAATSVRVEVMDVAGRLVKVLLNEPSAAGHRTIHWDGQDGSGRRVGSGIYFLQVMKPGSFHTQKLVRVEEGP